MWLNNCAWASDAREPLSKPPCTQADLSRSAAEIGGDNYYAFFVSISSVAVMIGRSHSVLVKGEVG